MPTPPTKMIHLIEQLEWLIQTDLAGRGIHYVPGENLCTQTQGALWRAIQFLAEHPGGRVGIVTGFFIPEAKPPAPETDGPAGALFLARGLKRLGYAVDLITDEPCRRPLEQGRHFFAADLETINLLICPVVANLAQQFQLRLLESPPPLDCLIAIERIGPCHTPMTFLHQQPPPDDLTRQMYASVGPGELAGNCLNMQGKSMDRVTAPLHELFDKANHSAGSIYTIGIGDGGNEIGMGSIPWKIIATNIRHGIGAKIACSVATDATIVAGVSNWGAYALTAGLYAYLDRVANWQQLFARASETELMKIFYRTQSAVDGRLLKPAMSVDGIPWEVHLQVLGFIDSMLTSFSQQAAPLT
ncbi:MAG: DUF4392 domain-containing protein [candidate division KSB1 bacterium]|nr:DUF4392 domain-containing protein [candidate division KSB1 bacterium]